MVRPTARCIIGISQQWRASFTDGNSVTPAQVTSINVKEEFVDLTILPGDRNSILVAGALVGQGGLGWRRVGGGGGGGGGEGMRKLAVTAISNARPSNVFSASNS